MQITSWRIVLDLILIFSFLFRYVTFILLQERENPNGYAFSGVFSDKIFSNKQDFEIFY